MNDNLARAVGAFLASPSIRLRYQILAAKGVSFSETRPGFPPAVEHRPEHQMLPPFDAAAAAASDGHPLAGLIRLRQEAADEIERLIAFLDASEGIVGEDVIDDDHDAAVDDAGCDDPDLDKEDGGDDEFNLGWTDIEAGTGRHGNNGLDLEDDDAFHDTDLGWTRTGALGNSSDLEISEVAL